MKDAWQEQFDFSKAERRGIFALLVLLVALVFVPKLFPLFAKQQTTINFEQQYNNFATQQAKIDQEEQAEYKAKKSYKKYSSPNNDFKKETLPKTATPQQSNQKQNNEHIATPIKIEKQTPKPISININSATAQDFAQLYGIGEVYSNRIIKFRNALGGFTSVNQVGDTYGIDKETFNAIKSQLTITNDYQPTKLNINTATAEQLKSHPYISGKLANQMVNYREKVHPFKSAKDVKSLYFVDDELFSKLHPYIIW